METFNRNVKWKVGLSNGETFYEGKGQFALIKDQLAPWHKLQQYLKDNNLTITSLSLYTDKGQVWNLPSAGKNPKFIMFQDLPQPIEFKYGRRFATDLNIPNSPREFLVFIEAVYETQTLRIIVNEERPEISWSLVK